MLAALIGCGVFLIAVGVWGAVQPNALQRWVAGLHPTHRYALAVGIRLALGVFLLAVAPEARWPGPTRIFGWIALAAAALLLVMGPTRLDRAVQWWASRPSTALRIASGVAMLLGAALVVDAL